MKHRLEMQSNLELKQSLVESLIIEDGRVSGVIDQFGDFYESKAVVVATGTFLHGLIHIGKSRIPSGRAGEFPSIALADQIKNSGSPSAG